MRIRGEKEKRRRAKFLVLGISASLLCSFSIFAQEILVKSKFQKDVLPLVVNNKTADILISNDDFKVIKIAANDFASDVEKVSNLKSQVRIVGENLSKNIVIIGTSGKNLLIESLIKSKKLEVSQIQNKWESFQIVTIKNTFPNVENALVIVGSDRRRTAFGVYEMSQKIGVSPWVGWADVAPEERENLIISKLKFVSNEPFVKYRGIFLNDEDWGLNPQAAKTFEPETGNSGPKTYAKIFEFLLRLKANTCWSARHEVTKPFNEIPENAKVADDDAIVRARKSILANAEIERETKYFNEQLQGGKWRYMMSPEMKEGEWTSMRSVPPKLVESDFLTSNKSAENIVDSKVENHLKNSSAPNSKKTFVDKDGVISMEAEHFTNKIVKNNFAWQIIKGLGKTGDSVSIFPQKAITFANLQTDAPALEYRLQVSNTAEFEANFYLIPVQPLVLGNGLRFAFSIDDETLQIVEVDKKIEIISPKWSQNVLNETTVGTVKINLAKGAHVLKIFAVDSGVVLDKIILSAGKMKTSCFGAAETVNGN